MNQNSKRPTHLDIPDDIHMPNALIQPEPEPEPPKIKPPKKKADKNVKPTAKFNSLGVVIFHHAITVSILLFLLGLGVWSYLTFSKSSFFVQGNAAETPPAVQNHIVQAQLQRIRTTLETFEVIHERYPARLEELVETGLLLPSDLYYPLATQNYLYTRHQHSYDLNLVDTNQPEFEILSDDGDELIEIIEPDDSSL